MRLAFWRSGKKPVVQRAAVRPAAPAPKSVAATDSGDLDLHVLGRALMRRRGWIIVPTVLALVGSLVAVNMITPRYKSEARILVDGRENVFLRPNGERGEERSALDAEAVTSQVQLVQSRDLAREIIKKNKLAELPEFDPVLRGFSPLKSTLTLIGIGRDPFSLTPEERVLEAYYERFTAYAVDKSRVIVIEFQSRDPELAARVANSIAEGYLVLQQDARQDQAKGAAKSLHGRIDELRKKVSQAESRVEEFRSKSSLFVGTNNTMLSNQQMGELNTQLINARALKSDAETKARLIKQMLDTGKPIEASEILNSELVRGLSEQRATLRSQLAEQSSTLLDGHPRIKELKAQLVDIDRQLREEASIVSVHWRTTRALPATGSKVPWQALNSRSGRHPRTMARTFSSARSSAMRRPSATSWNPFSLKTATRSARKPRGDADRWPHHLTRHRFQYAGLSEEAADRAHRDAGDLAAHLGRDCDRRAAAHDRAAPTRSYGLMQSSAK